jgi:uncharacterized protein YjbJ (UPF0337 family)
MCANAQNKRFPSRIITATSRLDKPRVRYEQRQEVDVNRDRLEGKWKQFSGSVREQWGRLTDDGLSVVAGQHDQLAGRVQERYGIYKEEGERQLKAFMRRNRDWNSTSR